MMNNSGGRRLTTTHRLSCCCCCCRPVRGRPAAPNCCILSVILLVVCTVAVLCGEAVELVLGDPCSAPSASNSTRTAGGNLAQLPPASTNTSTEEKKNFVKDCVAFNNKTGRAFVVTLLSPPLDHRSAADSRKSPPPFIKLIHRTWKTVDVPTDWKNGVMSCQYLNLDHVYCHWTDAELESFLSVEYPDFLPTYLGYPYDIQRVDAARYHVLHHYGGTYLDLDVICRRPLTDVLGEMPPHVNVVVAEAEPVGVVGDFIAVRRPRDPVLREIIDGLSCAAAASARHRWSAIAHLPYVEVMFGTGPVYLSRRISAARERRPSTAAEPDGIYLVPSATYNGVYFGHLGGATWHEWDGRLIWWFYQQRHRKLRWTLILAAVGTLVWLIVRRRRIIIILFSSNSRATVAASI